LLTYYPEVFTETKGMMLSENLATVVQIPRDLDTEFPPHTKPGKALKTTYREADMEVEKM